MGDDYSWGKKEEAPKNGPHADYWRNIAFANEKIEKAKVHLLEGMKFHLVGSDPSLVSISWSPWPSKQATQERWFRYVNPSQAASSFYEELRESYNMCWLHAKKYSLIKQSESEQKFSEMPRKGLYLP